MDHHYRLGRGVGWGGFHLSTPEDTPPPHLIIRFYDTLTSLYAYASGYLFHIFSAHTDGHRPPLYGSWEVAFGVHNKIRALRDFELKTSSSFATHHLFGRTYIDGKLQPNQLSSKIPRFLGAAAIVPKAERSHQTSLYRRDFAELPRHPTVAFPCNMICLQDVVYGGIDMCMSREEFLEKVAEPESVSVLDNQAF